jgi:coenzyme Q-binding protein COQ10
MPKVVMERTMAVSVEALTRVILDFEKYPEFLPEVVGAKSIGVVQKGVQEVEFEIEVIKRFRYRLQFDLTTPNEVRWRLVDSNFFTANEGAWLLTAAAKKKTDVKYELEVGVKFLVPGFISKKLTQVSLPKLLDSFEARAKEMGK